MPKKRLAPAPPGGEREIEPEWKVENVVATAVMSVAEGKGIDLNQIARKNIGCEYNPERFPGLVMRVASPKASVLLFRTGKMVLTGLRDASEAEAVADVVVTRIKEAKVDVAGKPAITIQNVVASGDLHVPVDLNEASVVMDNAMYEPEVFPGLIYRMAEPKAVFLVFSTGRVVCTGAKTKKAVGGAVRKLAAYIKESGLSDTESDIGEDGGQDFI
nr:TATA-box-binding protein [Candidatus Sigynarchaeum springense]